MIHRAIRCLAVLFPILACSAPAEPRVGEADETLRNTGGPFVCPNPPPKGTALPALDCDGDGLTNTEELALGTAPDSEDTDGDGLLDGWEVHGATHDVIDELGQPIATFFDYTGEFGCDPRHRDLLIENDVHQFTNNGQTHSAALSQALRDKLTDSFAAMPILNPDRTIGIHLVLVDDEQLGMPNGVIDPPGPVTTPNFDCYPGGGADGDHSRWSHPQQTFRKLTLCLRPGAGYRGNSVPGAGTAKLEAGETNNQTAAGSADDQSERAQFIFYQGILHELGHSLGLHHGGGNDENFKVNYPSVMNYKYDLNLCSPETLQGTSIGYSNGDLPELDACQLDEQSPFGALPFADHCFLSVGNRGGAPAQQPFDYFMNAAGVWVDWDRDSALAANPVVAAISDFGENGTLGPFCAAAGRHLVRDFDDFARIQHCIASPLRRAQGKPALPGCP